MSLTLLGRSRATMAQPVRTLPPNEWGKTLCRTPSGQLVGGPWSEGTPTRVEIAMVCPRGSFFEGLFHTHPGGSVNPSKIDTASAKKFSAQVLCISNDVKTKCFKVTGRR